MVSPNRDVTDYIYKETGTLIIETVWCTTLLEWMRPYKTGSIIFDGHWRNLSIETPCITKTIERLCTPSHIDDGLFNCISWDTIQAPFAILFNHYRIFELDDDLLDVRR